MKKIILSLLTLIFSSSFFLQAQPQENPAVTQQLKAKYGDAEFIVENKKFAYYKVGEFPEYGICDIHGKMMIENKYCGLYAKTIENINFHEGQMDRLYFMAYHPKDRDKKNKIGLLDENGKVVVPFDYCYISPTMSSEDESNDDLYFIVKKELDGLDAMGMANDKGKLVVPVKYDFVQVFNKGFFRTKTNDNKYGIYSEKDKEIIPPVYMFISLFGKNLFNVVEYGSDYSRNGIIDEKGKVFIPIDKHHFSLLNDDIIKSFGDYSIKLWEKPMQQLWSIKAKKAISNKYNMILEMKEDLFVVGNDMHHVEGGEDHEYEGGKWGFIDTNGNEIIPLIYDKVQSFKDGVAQVEKDGKAKLLTNPLHGTTLQVSGSQQIDTDIPVLNKTNEETFAFIFANENYNNFPEAAQFSINDGKIFAEYCRKTFGVPDNNVRYYEDATYGNMASAMKKIADIAEVYDGDASIIIYFSGLGYTDSKTNDAYLLPVDASLATIASTAYNMKDLSSSLNKLNTKSTLLFIDAPLSGLDKNGKSLSSSRGVAIKNSFKATEGNLVIMSSSGSSGNAYSSKKYAHGLYTYALLDYIKQKGGNCSIKEAIDYATKWVKKETLNGYEHSQTPEVIVAPNGKNKFLNEKK